MAAPNARIRFREEVFSHQDSRRQSSVTPENAEKHTGQKDDTDAVDPISHEPNADAGQGPAFVDMTPSPKQTARGNVTESEVTASPSAKSVRFKTTQSEAVPSLELGPPAQPPQKNFKTILEKKIHWVSKRVMLGCLLLAVAGVLGHHGFFSSLVAQPIGDQTDQQRTRLYVKRAEKSSHASRILLTTPQCKTR